MRNIEFRAWDKEKKYMAHDFSQSTAREYSLPLGKSIHGLVYDIGLLNDTLMQFTGLHVNGGKLFQGDLIMDHVGIGEVVWCSKNCAFKVSYRNENKGSGKWFCDYLDSEFKSIEIIGNIHEAK